MAGLAGHRFVVCYSGFPRMLVKLNPIRRVNSDECLMAIRAFDNFLSGSLEMFLSPERHAWHSGTTP
jgi:hypothetical protein